MKSYSLLLIGMVSIVQMLASPMSPPTGAYLFRTGGYVCVFSSQLTVIVLASAYLVWTLKSYNWTPTKNIVMNLISYSFDPFITYAY